MLDKEKVNKIYNDLHELYNSGELEERLILKSDVKLRSLLIDLCGSIGEDYSVFVDLSCFD
tara:strand:+ start:799 stop:981 length:183 start_codon:yes stop_codon:yes gene_type:complete